MKTRSFCFLLLLLSVLFSCTNGEQMRLQLAELERQNRADSLMTNDSLALTLANYFDRHGTPNEQMRAHYILGRTYYDLDRQPEALNAYQDAADYADTTAQDCDYYTLCRVHGQMGELFYNQQLPRNALIAFQQAYYHAKQSEGARTAACFYVQQGKCYYDLNLADSCTYILQNAVQMLLKCGDTILANTNKGPLAYALVKQGKLAEAKEYLEAYEHHSLLSEAALQSSDNWKLFYIYKAFYYQHVAHCDSAFYYYRKALNTTKNPNNRTLAYHGLYQTYALLHQSDSVLKYAVLYAKAAEQSHKQATASALLSMHHLYNYDRFKDVAQQKEREAFQTRQTLIIFIAFAVIASILITIKIISWRKRKLRELNQRILQEQEKFKKMEDEYETKIHLQEEARKQLSRMQETNFKNIIKEKEQEIICRQQEIDALAEQLQSRLNVDESMIATDIYRKFSYYTTHTKEKPSNAEIEDLMNMIEQHLPTFYTLLHSGRSINKNEYLICVLIRLHFAQVEISALTGIATPNLTRKRRHLLSKCFGLEGSAEEFNERILSIK